MCKTAATYPQNARNDVWCRKTLEKAKTPREPPKARAKKKTRISVRNAYSPFAVPHMKLDLYPKKNMNVPGY